MNKIVLAQHTYKGMKKIVRYLVIADNNDSLISCTTITLQQWKELEKGVSDKRYFEYEQLKEKQL